METARRKICIITGTRAEWGLLETIARQLRDRKDTQLQIVATNMHLDPRYGHTVDEIEAGGYRVDARVAMASDDDSRTARIKAMGQCMSGMADAFAALKPDLAVILGDRYEMLAVASAALMSGIPIAHLHGGEITNGAIDDSIRHAITKMASLHLTSTEGHRRRVIRMGEAPERVINTGAIGVYNAINEPVMSLSELEESLGGMKVDRRTVIVTFHAATLDPADPADRFAALLEALDRQEDVNVIMTYPNNDRQGRRLIAMIEEYAAARRGRVLAVPTLGKRRYLSALRYAGAVVGNSSSGIIEVPSAGIPTVDIGIRQQGREASEAVIHCGDSADEISGAIRLALSPEGRERAAGAANPYGGPDTLKKIIDALTLTPLEALRTKTFYDING